MQNDDKKPPSIFSTLMQAGQATLEAQIQKARNSIVMNQNVDDDEFFYAKAVVEEPNYSIHTSGWKEKPTRLQNSHLKQMSIKNTVSAAIIQTRQNQVARHSCLVESEQETGFMVKLRNEKDIIEEVKVKLREEMDQQQQEAIENGEAPEADNNDLGFDKSTRLLKANGDGEIDEVEGDAARTEQQAEDKNKSDDEVEKHDWELERKAKELVRKKFAKDMRVAEQYVLNCGKLEGRPFDKKKWIFDSALRALVRDTYTYDLYATETVPDNAGRPHYWFPVDGGTIKYASADLKRYKDLSTTDFARLDILYPERNAAEMVDQGTLDLDEKALDAGAYKWVQTIRGKIERAYTEDELKVGIRNINTDIYNNGYGLSELELAVSLVTGHLNAEYYNQAYFTQGFSAKGILHIKAAINRRKLETVRQQWQHMVRGSKNSFQTPIFAGVNEVQWIPLTQNHDDIGFEGWMRYLIKMMCAIFQIDPAEIGIGFKDEGPGGGGLSGDNTQEKLQQSKDKGLVPLLRHLEHFINENILKPFDDRFVIEFTGITDENRQEALDRQEREVKFKKTVNEIREEDGLPPIPGMDNIILSQEFLAWFAQFSEEAQELTEKNMQQQQDMMNDQEGGDFQEEDNMYNEENVENNMFNGDPADTVNKALTRAARGLKKSKARRPKKKRPIKIEYYRTED